VTAEQSGPGRSASLSSPDGKLRFDGRTAIITGAGRGLGRSYALSLAARGCQVVVNDLGVDPTGQGSSTSAADEVVEEIKQTGGSAAADYGNVAENPGEIVRHAIDEFGSVDIVINNAGFMSPTTPFEQATKAELDRVLAVHLGGSTELLRAAWPHMLARRYGRVVNVSSAGAWGVPGISSYACAKSGVIGLTRVLAQEGRPSNIHVNAVMPHGLTRMLGSLPDEHPLAVNMRKYFRVEQVAPFVVWLTHEETEVTGEVFGVGGGRAARVFLAEASGVMAPENTPEAWQTSVEQLMAVSSYRIPSTTTDEMEFALDELRMRESGN
jgi:NAD(P)-dependent dehydrogenase (short-subunit alcohol dehydrogenase family)